MKFKFVPKIQIHQTKVRQMRNQIPLCGVEIIVISSRFQLYYGFFASQGCRLAELGLVRREGEPQIKDIFLARG